MNSTKHTLTQFDVELEDIRDQVLLMGGLVESQIRQVIEALMHNDVTLMDCVIENDICINAMDVSIDEKCVQIIARRQPAANDLRMIMAVIKITADIERIGDEAKKIARIGKALSQREHHQPPRYTEIRHASRIVLEMLLQSLDGFVRLDASNAVHVIRQDQRIDDEYHAILRYLVALMMEDPRTISSALDALFIAKSVERMGDHSKNIAENMIYMVEGRNARHIFDAEAVLGHSPRPQ